MSDLFYALLACVATIPSAACAIAGFGLALLLVGLPFQDIAGDATDDEAERDRLLDREAGPAAMIGGPELRIDSSGSETESLERTWCIPLCELWLDHD